MSTDTPPTGHPLNRHLFIVDNYHLLKSLDTESIDLICTDPPFAKNETFIGGLIPPLTDEEHQRERDKLRDWGIRNPADAERNHVTWPTGATTAKFRDIWSWEKDVHEQWMDDIKDTRPNVLNVIETTRYTHGEGTAAYLTYIAVRLIECHRVLKTSGSIYLHCDHTANSYLRMLLDAIFGTNNFRNDIIWSYRTGGVSKRYWPRKHDTLLFYVKSEDYKHNAIQERIYYKKPFFTTKTDGHGRHYADVFIRDVWGDIKPLINVSSERTGYPTQKPVALAERIIRASSDPGDIVLDPFAGCAYVAVAAERLGRQWIACDISPRALTVLRRQFAKFAYYIEGEDQAAQKILAEQISLDEPEASETPDEPETQPEKVSLANADVKLRGPNQMPVRTTVDDDIPSVKPLPQPKYKTTASIFTREEMLDYLLGLSGWRAWCCGFANWKVDADGAPVIERTIRNFELDHIDPKSKQGRHEIDNRAPLCPYHNSMKSDRRILLDDLREQVQNQNELLVSSVDDLVDLAWARDKAIEHLIAEKPRRIR
ncbi:MAG: DNA methyltransferase [Acidimicrobiaceae bacterium]|nr:HNH endonuclease [Acidimicrobiia bacterium]MCY4493255.1 DNA methyltransferase [Acidimicrobiaceae bacterium]